MTRPLDDRRLRRVWRLSSRYATSRGGPTAQRFLTIMQGAVSLCALLVAACVSDPIEWETRRDVPGTIGATTQLVVDAHGNPRLVDERAPRVTLSPRACDASVTTTPSHDGEWYAAWFVARPDGSVVLIVGRSTDGGATWSAHVADDRDRGQRGCSRPRPALRADSASGYVHAAYYLEPADGAGVWYTHSMERGTVWHQTIGVLYGEEPVSVSLASAGDTVLVAYEHPGSGGRRLGLAISRHAGHAFDERLRVVRSSEGVLAPRVALKNGRVALAWLARAPVTGMPLARRARLLTGRFR